MKTGQAEKFLKARKDPSFARAMQIKELSPAQSAGQNRLRKVVQITDSRLSELDAGIASLKRRANGPSSPSQNLERIQRSVRNVDVAIRDRQQSIDELARRVSSLRVREGSELRSREGSPFASATASPAPVRQARTSTPKRSSASAAHSSPRSFETPEAPESPAPPPSLEPTDAMRAAAKQDGTLRRNVGRALAQVSKRKGEPAPVTLISRATPVSTSTAKPKPKAAPSLVEHASVARGPVMLDAMPIPGSVRLGASKGVASGAQPPTPSPPTPSPQTQPQPQPQSAWPSTAAHVTPAQSTPAPPPAPAPGGFAGIKLELSPSAFTSTASSERAPRSSLRSSNFKSSHTPAVKLSSTPTLPPAGGGGTLFGGVSPSRKEEARKAPPGFVR